MNSEWNQFVASSPHGDVLQCREWGEVKRPEWQPVAVVLRNQSTLTATALILQRKIPYSDRTMFYIPRGPILDWNDVGLVRELFSKIQDEAEKRKAR